MTPTPPDEPPTLVELLRRRAWTDPDATAFTFLPDGADPGAHLTYAELDRRARAFAAWLQRRGVAGERVALVFPPGLGFVAAFFGALYAGSVTVPAPAPSSLPHARRSDDRLDGILADARARFVLTTAQVRKAAAGSGGPVWLAAEEVPAGVEADWREPNIAGGTLALLQYTSGSTTAPRGVALSHANVLANLALIRRGFCTRSPKTGVFWLPVHHDMGLIGGVLEPVYVGGPSVLMAPASFLRRPARWLQAISDHRATISGAPNFAYDLCAERVTPADRANLDLSRWELAFCGAEPVRRETLERFAATFAPCGFRPEAFYPCYGLAEATLMVSGGEGSARPRVVSVCSGPFRQGRVVRADPGGAEAETQSLVGCGVALPGQTVRIVNPETRTPCPPDEVGEIWVAGPGVACGYWDRPEETVQTFHARLASTDDGDGPFLRTGDLGFFDDGELVVTGRLNDLIIVHGLNHYPQDIERTVDHSHPALRKGSGAAFTAGVSGRDHLVIVHEVSRRDLEPGRGMDDVIAAIRRAVSEGHGLQADTVVLVAPRGVPKTTSDKVRRSACRDAFLAEGLNVVASWRTFTPSATAIEAWLVARIAGLVGTDPGGIDRRRPFAELGLNSVQAACVAGHLEAWLGKRLPETLVYDHPTIGSLARHLAGEPAEGSDAGRRPAGQGPVAVVGLGCRFPGAKDVGSFWRLLRDGVDAVTRVPEDRWDLRRFFHPDPATPGKMNTAWGGFLDGVDRFDPDFFGISPREAARMDPQHRLVLEVAWEALEHAGMVPGRLAGSRTGVFLGISGNDYGRLQSGDPALADAYDGTGNALSVAANRVSYLLDLRGPSLAVDTACSSSLAAVHLACEGLRRGECDLALAGGVNVILAPELTVVFSQARMMALDGRCKAFDAAADGYARGEGCGVVVLKRLEDALRDGDTVLALIRGTAVNHGGRGNGLTAPVRMGQQAVIHEALADAGVDPDRVGYVEAHGTGTALGDPIEFEALLAALGGRRAHGGACALGSVKTNIGHLEAAAGVAGLIKVVLALRHGEIPPHLHLNELNPRIALDGTSFVIPTARQPWPAGPGLRVAGVSAFGFGGANAHVIVEEAPETGPPAGSVERPLHVLTLSARTGAALTALAGRYAAYLGEAPPVALADVAFTANTGRTAFPHRLTVVAGDAAEMRERLSALDDGRLAPGAARGHVATGTMPEVVFLFPDGGRLDPGTGRTLFETSPVFREAMGRADRGLRPLLGRPLWEVLDPGPGQDTGDLLRGSEFGPPAWLALGYALAALWRSWGVGPGAVLGLGLGELTAACVTGSLSLEDGLRLAVERGREARGTTPDDFAAGLRNLAGHGAALFLELGPGAALLHVLRESLGRRKVTWLPSLRRGRDDWRVLLTSLAAMAARGVAVDWAGFDRPYPRRRVFAPTYPFERVRCWLPDQRDAVTAEPLRLRPAAPPAAREVEFGLIVFSASEADGSPSGNAYRLLVESARFADRHGFSAVWVPERHFTRDGHLYPNPAVIHAALARETTRIHLRAGSVVLPLHHPARVAEEWAVVDNLSGGRVGLSFASGWHPDDFALAPNPDRYADRHETMERAVRTVQALWRGETVPVTAGDGRRVEVRTYPRPVQPELPVWITAAGNPRTFAFAGASGANLLTHLFNQGLDELAGKVRLYREARERAGHDPSTGRVSVMLHTFVGGDAKEVRAKALPALATYLKSASYLLEAIATSRGQTADLTRMSPADVDDYARFVGDRLVSTDRVLFGTPETCARLVARLRAAGVDELACQLDFGLDTEIVLASLPHLDRLRERCNLYPAAVPAAPPLPSPQSEALPAAPRDEVSDSMYVLRWQLAPERPGPAEGADGSWLILADRGGLGVALAGALEARGGRCVLVTPGEGFDRATETRFRVHPERPEDIDRVLGAVADDGRRAVRGVVHLWALDAPASGDGPDTAFLDEAQRLGCAAALLWLQVMARREWPAPPRVWLVTRGAQAVPDESAPVAVAQAPLWGFGRAAAREEPDLWGGLVDLDPRDSNVTDAARFLANEVMGPDGDDEVAFRRGRRFVTCWARAPVEPVRPAALRPDASYLITGGLGDLGLQVARWMVERGARHVVLLGRTALPPRSGWGPLPPDSAAARRVAAVKAMESSGAEVRVVAADVADGRALGSFLGACEPPVRGVIHAAAEVRGGTLRTLDAGSFRQVFRSKAAGGWVLDRLVGDAPLDFFVLFSAVPALLGWLGQGAANYAAASAFLNALAHDRRARGKPALSVNWGPWAEVGLAARTEGGLGRLAAQGVEGLPPDRALDALGRLLSGSATEVAVADLRWPQFLRAWPGAAASPRFSGFARWAADPSAPVVNPPLRDAIRSAAPDQRASQLEAYLQDMITQILGAGAVPLDPHRPLVSLGLDSLVAIELRNRVEGDLGIRLPLTDLLKGPSLARLTERVLAQVTADTPQTPE